MAEAERKWFKNRLIAAVSVIITGSSLLGAMWAFDGHYAKAKDLQTFKDSVQIKFDTDRYKSLQERIWQLEEHFGGPGVPRAPRSIKKEYVEIKSEFEILRARLNKGAK